MKTMILRSLAVTAILISAAIAFPESVKDNIRPDKDKTIRPDTDDTSHYILVPQHYERLEDAIRAVYPGGVIYIAAGQHLFAPPPKGYVVEKNSVTIIGGGDVIIDAGLRELPYGNRCFTFKGKSHNVVLRRLNLINTTKDANIDKSDPFGAIFFHGGDRASLDIIDCTISGNRLIDTSVGSAITQVGGSVSIRNSVITGNESRRGATIYTVIGKMKIVNCLIYGNESRNCITAPIRSSLVIINSTIADNIGDERVIDNTDFQSTYSIRNSIIWNTSMEEIYRNVLNTNTSVEYTNIRNGFSSDDDDKEDGKTGKEKDAELFIYDLDPLFVDPLNADFNLSPGSSCIDSAKECICTPPDDRRGNTRIDDPSSPNLHGSVTDRGSEENTN